MTKTPPTLVDQFWRRIKNYRFAAALIVIGGAVIGISQFTGAIGQLSSWFGPSKSERAEYCGLLMPLVAQFDRTKEAFDRWHSKNLPLEVAVIKPANEEARRLLLENAGLVHTSLRDDARELVRHYDCWLEEYNRQREQHGDTGVAFIFVAPQGCGFPRQAEARFRT